MFHDLDEALRQLLVREMPIRNGEVDIRFDQPTREWSARLSRPTLNLFLYDLRENLKLRASQQWTITRNKDGSATQRRTPARMDLHYMLTAWAREADDEHNLLARAPTYSVGLDCLKIGCRPMFSHERSDGCQEPIQENWL